MKYLLAILIAIAFLAIPSFSTPVQAGDSSGFGPAVCPFCGTVVNFDASIKRVTRTNILGGETWDWVVYCPNPACKYTTERDNLGQIKTNIREDAQLMWVLKKWMAQYK